MLTGMTERDWLIALEEFDAVQSSWGQPGRDDRKFLEAIHYFTVHSITVSPRRRPPCGMSEGASDLNGAGKSAAKIRGWQWDGDHHRC